VRHPRTTALATLLAKAKTEPEELSKTALAIEQMFSDWSDERKADLYALVEHAIRDDMTFAEVQTSLDLCLIRNQERHG